MAMQENGLNIIISLVLNDIKPLADDHMELALEIKSQASKLLLAIMESRHDSENADRVLQNMDNTDGGPRQLVHAITQAYEMAHSKQYEISQMKKELLQRASLQDRPRSVVSPLIKTESVTLPEISVDSSGTVSIHDDAKSELKYVSEEATSVDPKEVGHNIYILAHQLSRHSPELAEYLNPDDEKKSSKTRNALSFYKKHTAQIEIVRQDRKLERVVFPIHEICSFLTKETKQNVYNNTEKDAQGSKVTEFFDQWPALYEEMKWQRKLQAGLYASNPFMYTSVVISIIFLYSQWDENSSLAKSSNIITAIAAVMFSAAILLISLFGLVPALYIIGAAQLTNKCVHLVAYASNKGLEDKSWSVRLSDGELHYHLVYLVVCFLGLFVHPMLYCLLLFDIVASEETLRNVISSVTKNWQSIILTGLLALILIYIFSIIEGSVDTQDLQLLRIPTDSSLLIHTADFIREVDRLEPEPPVTVFVKDPNPETCASDGECPPPAPVVVEEKKEGDGEDKIASCETLRMCIITTLNWGLRNGGGIGDVLRNVAPDENLFYYRIIYDLSFYVVLIVIVLNLVFGVIVDTFGDLRTEKNDKEDVLKNSCFICGLERGKYIQQDYFQLTNKCVHLVAYASNKGLEDKSWSVRLSDGELHYHLVYLVVCFLGLFVHPMLYCLLLFDIVASEETLRNVISSVTKNWQSIILTGLLALILIYIFSIIGYSFFQKDFIREVDRLEPEPPVTVFVKDPNPETCASDGECPPPAPVVVEEKKEGDGEDKIASCETLRMCIITTLNWGLRNGGGIGDVLRNVAPEENLFYYRIIYDLSFYVVLIVIVLNLVFGVIVDTFGDLRTEKNDKEDVLKNSCFICGLERGKFDNRSVTFEDHQAQEHNLWHYLYFIVWLQIKDETEFTGPESYVAQCIKDRKLDWFPRMQAISLQDGDSDSDQPEITAIREQLRLQNQSIRELTATIDDLRQFEAAPMEIFTLGNVAVRSVNSATKCEQSTERRAS
ncbi:transporter, cation channel family protein [Ancylostoma duodenale]|uniref:Transporter, cation channel family protein n=2 Tax=Ancylostoma duodenale TaxID=51022 RepID=A0A0C2GMK5_9BILA|nr:transporter, cation channel family protein [Ancylostoma duodenale]